MLRRKVFLAVNALYLSLFFFFNDTATTEIYTLSLHDALPISSTSTSGAPPSVACLRERDRTRKRLDRQVVSSSARDRKSTRLNSSHVRISYAVFCLKKKKTNPHCSSFTLSTTFTEA